MNAIADKLQKTIKAEEARLPMNTDLQAQIQFLDEMKRLGIYKKPEYTLPLVDTLGKAYYGSSNKNNSLTI